MSAYDQIMARVHDMIEDALRRFRIPAAHLDGQITMENMPPGSVIPNPEGGGTMLPGPAGPAGPAGPPGPPGADGSGSVTLTGDVTTDGAAATLRALRDILFTTAVPHDGEFLMYLASENKIVWRPAENITPAYAVTDGGDLVYDGGIIVIESP